MENSLTHLRIAILGATGYIGRSLLFALKERGVDVTGYSRDSEKGKAQLALYGITASLREYDTFLHESYDVVINATGIGSPAKLKESPHEVFTVTEFMDDMILSYLQRHPATCVFNLSSGAIHNEEAKKIFETGSFIIANLNGGESYAIAKLASEERHRSWKEFAIIDLRVFAFFSRFVDTKENFLLSQIVAAIEKKEIFKTSTDNIVRDFTSADGILDAIAFLFSKKRDNAAYDLVSKEPITKFALLEYCKKEWGIEYEIAAGVAVSPTGTKPTYVSSDTSLADLGFESKETSLKTIDREMRARLS